MNPITLQIKKQLRDQIVNFMFLDHDDIEDEYENEYIVPPLFEFTRDNCGFTKVINEHREWCDWIVEFILSDYVYEIERLEPRGSLKTTIFAISLPIWFELTFPDKRTMVMADKFENASIRLEHQKKIINFRPWFRDNNIYITAPNNNREFNLNINSFSQHKEAAFTASGLFSHNVGYHGDLITGDDIVNDDDRESPALREKKKRKLQDIPTLLDPGGKFANIGTRWHFDDAHNYLIVDWKIKHIIGTPYKEDGSLRFEIDGEGKEWMTQEYLDEQRRKLGEIHFSSQYMNNPLPESIAIFTKDMMKFYNKDNVNEKNLVFYGFVDLSLGKSAKGDFSAIITIGMDESEKMLYIWDCVVRRMKPSVSLDLMLESNDYYYYNVFGVEENQFQVLVKEEFERRLIEENKMLFVKGYTSTRKKEGRIEGLQLWFNNKRLLFPENYKDSPDFCRLMEQLLYFGATDHDDGPDALSYCVELALNFGQVMGIG